MPMALKGLHVWQKVKDVVLDDVHEQFVVCPHNPDRLRRPSPSAGARHSETLELATASLVASRLHAPTECVTVDSAPQHVRAVLRGALCRPPAQRLVELHQRDLWTLRSADQGRSDGRASIS
jgi:hypothetical protein